MNYFLYMSIFFFSHLLLAPVRAKPKPKAKTVQTTQNPKPKPNAKITRDNDELLLEEFAQNITAKPRSTPTDSKKFSKNLYKNFEVLKNILLTKDGRTEDYKLSVIRQLNIPPDMINKFFSGKNESNPLILATFLNLSQVVDFFLNELHANPNIQANDKTTPLCIAVQNNNEDIVRLLLQNQADPNIAGKDRTTPLFFATQQDSTEILKLLLLNHADPNIQRNDGMTPLFFATQQDKTEMVSLLLQNPANPHNRANPDIANNNGATPLFFAAQEGKAVITKLLLLNHANPNLATNTKATPLFIATKNDHIGIVNLLLQHRADPNLVTNDSATPLYIAAQNGYINIVHLLLQHRAYPNLVTNDGATPLYIAAQNGYINIVRLLLQNQADPNLVTNDGATPLFIAAQKGYINIVHLLLQNQADPNAVTVNGFSAMMIAKLLNHHEIVDLLRRYNAQENEFNPYELYDTETSTTPNPTTRSNDSDHIDNDQAQPDTANDNQNQSDEIKNLEKEERKMRKQIAAEEQFVGKQITALKDLEYQKQKRQERLFNLEQQKFDNLLQRFTTDAETLENTGNRSLQNPATTHRQQSIATRIEDMLKAHGGISIKYTKQAQEYFNTLLKNNNYDAHALLPFSFKRRFLSFTNVFMNLYHIINPTIKLTVDQANNLLIPEISGGHTIEAIHLLEDLDIVDIIRATELSNGAKEYLLKNKWTQKNFIKTIFPENWSNQKIAEAIYNGTEIRRQEASGLKDALEITTNYQNVSIKIIISHNTIITAYPVGTSTTSSAHQSTPQSAIPKRADLDATPNPKPKSRSYAGGGAAA